MADSHLDPEKGLISPVAHSIISPAASAAPLNAKNLSNQSSLQLFQELVGLRTPSTLDHDDAPKSSTATAPNANAWRNQNKKSSKNLGLYQRARAEERKSRLSYVSTSIISNTLYMLQILLAATFTALSAYKDSNPVTLTVLGAVNTVVAGSLAWQKGQGVPQRYRKAQDQYQALILEIEMAERSFIDVDHSIDAGGAKLDPHAEKARLFKLYDTAKADQQANYPDLYVSTASAAAKGGQEVAKQMDDAKTAAAKDLEDAQAAAAKNLEDAKAEAAKGVEDAKAEVAKVRAEMIRRFEELAGRVEGRVEKGVESAVDGVLKKAGS